MKAHQILLAAACLFLSTADTSAQSIEPMLFVSGASAQSTSAAPASLLPLSANRIVGLWHVTVQIGACQGGPVQNFIALADYHAGGTLDDTNSMPSTSRGPGQGIWSFEGRGKYRSRFQFYRYLPTGAYDGLQDIEGVLVLDARGTRYSQTIRAHVLDTDGSVRVELCGSANGERVAMIH